MAAPSYVYTISCVAKILGEPADWLDELASMNLEPEDEGRPGFAKFSPKWPYAADFIKKSKSIVGSSGGTFRWRSSR
jgi:hypothetical protein